MIFKKGELSILWPFYLYFLVYGLSTMIMPFMILYFINLGLSYFQISIIVSVFGLSMFIFEIPTGAFADGYSRKYSVILGFIITGLFVSMVPFVSSFYLSLLLWFIIGVGMTFVSGAEESWVIDNLNALKRKDLQQEYFIKFGSITGFGAIFAPFIGALLVKNYSIGILWYVFGFGFLINGLLLWFFTKEYYKPKRINFTKSVLKAYDNSKKGVKFAFTHKIVFLIIIAGIFSQLMTVGENGWQPYLVDLGMLYFQLGYLYSLLAFIMMVMPFLSRLFSNMKPKYSVAIITLIRMIILLSLMFVHPGLLLLASFVFLMNLGLYSMNEPIIQSYFHKFIRKNIRATVISAKNMISQLVMVLGSLVAGLALDFYGPQIVISLGGLFGIVAIILYLKIED